MSGTDVYLWAEYFWIIAYQASALVFLLYVVKLLKFFIERRSDKGSTWAVLAISGLIFIICMFIAPNFIKG